MSDNQCDTVVVTVKWECKNQTFDTPGRSWYELYTDENHTTIHSQNHSLILSYRAKRYFEPFFEFQ